MVLVLVIIVSLVGRYRPSSYVKTLQTVYWYSPRLGRGAIIIVNVLG